MDFKVHCIVLVSILPLAHGCDTKNNDLNNPQTAKSVTNEISLLDSLKSTTLVKSWEICSDFLEKYSESKKNQDLDSAKFYFQIVSENCESADPYLRMGSTCELLEEKGLSNSYFNEGKLKNIEIMDTLSINSQELKLFELYDFYFKILLNENFHEKRLFHLEKELSESPILKPLISESHKREALIEEFSL